MLFIERDRERIALFYYFKKVNKKKNIVIEVMI